MTGAFYSWGGPDSGEANRGGGAGHSCALPGRAAERRSCGVWREPDDDFHNRAPQALDPYLAFVRPPVGSGEGGLGYRGRVRVVIVLGLRRRGVLDLRLRRIDWCDDLDDLVVEGYVLRRGLRQLGGLGGSGVGMGSPLVEGRS